MIQFISGLHARRRDRRRQRIIARPQFRDLRLPGAADRQFIRLRVRALARYVARRYIDQIPVPHYKAARRRAEIVFRPCQLFTVIRLCLGICLVYRAVFMHLTVIHLELVELVAVI